MGDPNAAPRRPGSMDMHLEFGNSTVAIDGYRLEQLLRGISVSFDSKTRRPVVILDIKPSVVNLTAATVEIKGDFREFLISHGWRPPE